MANLRRLAWMLVKRQGQWASSNNTHKVRHMGAINDRMLCSTLTHFWVSGIGEDGALDRSAIGNCLIRIDALVGHLAAKVVRDHLLHPRNACAATHQDNLVYVLLLQSCILHCLYVHPRSYRFSGH